MTYAAATAGITRSELISVRTRLVDPDPANGVVLAEVQETGIGRGNHPPARTATRPRTRACADRCDFIEGSRQFILVMRPGAHGRTGRTHGFGSRKVAKRTDRLRPGGRRREPPVMPPRHLRERAHPFVPWRTRNGRASTTPQRGSENDGTRKPNHTVDHRDHRGGWAPGLQVVSAPHRPRGATTTRRPCPSCHGISGCRHAACRSFGAPREHRHCGLRCQPTEDVYDQPRVVLGWYDVLRGVRLPGCCPGEEAAGGVVQDAYPRRVFRV